MKLAIYRGIRPNIKIVINNKDVMSINPPSANYKAEAILVAINDAQSLSASGSPVLIHPNVGDLVYVSTIEIKSFIEKLANDNGVINILSYPSKDPFARGFGPKPEECYEIQVLPEFKAFYNTALSKRPPTKNISIDELMQQRINSMYEDGKKKALVENTNMKMKELIKKKKEQRAKSDALNVNKSSERTFWIEFDRINKKVILNDVIILAEPKPGSEAWKLISALVDEPNKELDLSNICSGDVHAAYRDLGFRKGIKDLFLEVGKDKIKFINPVSRNRFEKLENKNSIRVYFKPQE